MEDYWVDVVYGPNNPDSFIVKDPPESLPTSGYVGFVAPKKEKTMPEPIKTPLGAEVRVFVTTPDMWMVPPGSVMLQMSIGSSPADYRQAEVVLNQKNIDELITALQSVQERRLTTAERAARFLEINEQRRRVFGAPSESAALNENGHVWRTIEVSGETKEECVHCGVWKADFDFNSRCPAVPKKGV